MPAPLRGIRVVDFGQGGAGPYCGQLLGDYGADVLKVEPPRGDWGRTMGTLDPDLGFSGTYASMNRNKRSICLDLSVEVARDAARDLVRESDVVVESFRPGVMDRLGLGFESLCELREDLIFCSISAFGQTGPLAQRPGSDSVIQPYSGLPSINGTPGGKPLRIGNIVSDMLAAMNGFSAVLLALMTRNVEPGPRRLSVSLLDSILAFQTTCYSEFLVTGRAPTPPGNRHPLLPTAGIFEASDGFLTMAVLDHYWERFCAAIGREHLAQDPRFATSEDRQSNRDALWDMIEEVFRTQSVAHWLHTLEAIGVLCGPVNDYPSVVNDPQVQHSAVFGESRGHKGAIAPMVKAPIDIEDHQVPYGHPPSLGEHTEEVLREVAGYSDEAIDRLKKLSAIPVAAPTVN